MDDSQFQRALSEARGFVELGMYREAWDVVEKLPHDRSRLRSETVAVKLLVCTGLKEWNMGAAIMQLITAEHPAPEREAAGKFCLGYAVSLCERGDIEGARECVRWLSRVWPEGREHVAASVSLRAMWP